MIATFVLSAILAAPPAAPACPSCKPADTRAPSRCPETCRCPFPGACGHPGCACPPAVGWRPPEEWRPYTANPVYEVFGRETDGVFRYTVYRRRASRPAAVPQLPAAGGARVR